MINTINKALKNKKGFTLVELIIVIAILGIIAAIAVPKFKNIQESSKRKADVVTAKMLAKATELAIVEEKITIPKSGTYEVSLTELATEGYLDGDDTKSQSKTGKEFEIKVDSKGRVAVQIENGSTDIDLYPEPDDDYKK